MKDNKGFTLLETVVAASILFTVILIVVPISSLLMIERNVQSERYEYTKQLQLELQPFIHRESKLRSTNYNRVVNNKKLSFHITKENNNLIKGCVTWENVRTNQEETCLYGYIKK